MITFEVIHTSSRSRARVGRIHTTHGIIETPNFVPVATHAALKSVDTLFSNNLNIQLQFCNTYHLMLHPGSSIVAAAGGLHQFMKRSHPIITDSGGFQVFSLAYGGVHDELKSKGTKKQDGSVQKITEDGVIFRSYRDGSLLLLTPESSVQAQKELGADIILPLDELPPYHTDPSVLRRSLERTHRWELRSLYEHKKNTLHQGMFGIIHGGIDPELRRFSAQFLSEHAFDGYAIGGSIGKNLAEMVTMLSDLMPYIPPSMPVHLLGIGDIPSLARTVPLGIDTFDSSYPSRSARHGVLFTRSGNIRIVSGMHQSSFQPIDSLCSCMVCTTHTRAYIHHLFKAHELSAYTLATIHNIQFMMDLMTSYREQILNDEI